MKSVILNTNDSRQLKYYFHRHDDVRMLHTVYTQLTRSLAQPVTSHDGLKSGHIPCTSHAPLGQQRMCFTTSKPSKKPSQAHIISDFRSAQLAWVAHFFPWFTGRRYTMPSKMADTTNTEKRNDPEP